MEQTSEKPKISIFIGVHKWIKFLEYCLDSIINQTYDNWELVILDNSDIDINDLVHKHIIKNKPFNICTFKGLQDKIKIHKSLTDNHNIGYIKGIAAKLCTGDILCEMDYDDILMPRALESLAQAYQKTDCDYFYSDWINVDCCLQKGQITSRYGELVLDVAEIDYPEIGTIKVNVFGLRNLAYDDIRYRNYLPLHIRAWKREFFHLIDGYDANLHVVDDNDIQFKSFIYGKVCRICYPACICNYHDENSTKSFKTNYITNLVDEIFKKYDEKLYIRFLDAGTPFVTTFIPEI